MNISGILENVTMKELPSGTPVFKLNINSKTVDTFDRELATKAKELKGKVVTVDVTETQNGEWTNYKLKGITLGSGGTSFSEPSDREKEKEKTIRKAVAFKGAVELLQYFPADEKNLTTLDFLSRWCYEFLGKDWDKVEIPEDTQTAAVFNPVEAAPIPVPVLTQNEEQDIPF